MACCFKNLWGSLTSWTYQYYNIQIYLTKLLNSTKSIQIHHLGHLFLPKQHWPSLFKKTLRNYCYCNQKHYFFVTHPKKRLHQQQLDRTNQVTSPSIGPVSFRSFRQRLYRWNHFHLPSWPFSLRPRGFSADSPQRILQDGSWNHLLGSEIPTFIEHLADLLVIFMTFCREVSLIYRNNYIFKFRSWISSPCYTLWFLDPGSKSLKLKVVQEQIAVAKPIPFRPHVKPRKITNEATNTKHTKHAPGTSLRPSISPHFPTPCIFRYIPAAHRQALHSCWMYFGLSVLAFAPNVVAVDLTNTPPVGIDILGQNSQLPKGIAS